MGIEIRTVREEETAAWLDSLGTGFLHRVDARVADEVRLLWDYSRVWAAVDDGAIVGTTRTWATELTLPGGARVPASAVAAATVLPTHRRRGILSRLLATEHAAAIERGEPVAVLYASEYPIYGRFGYGPACATATWSLDVAATAFHPTVTAPGTVELLPATEDTRDALVAIFEAWRVQQPGEIKRRAFRWDIDLGLRESISDPTWKGFVAVHRDAAGSADGYVRYHAEQKSEQRQPRSILQVDELHALSDGGYAALWAFLASVDLVSTVRAAKRRPTERLPWLLTNARAADPSEVGDGLWVRLLDAPRVLASRAWEGAGSLVIEIVGDVAGEAETRTRVLLDASPDGATCVTSDRSADLTLDAAALGAAVLGGTRLRDAVAGRGVDEHRPGALASADALFATLDPPWCSTLF